MGLLRGRSVARRSNMTLTYGVRLDAPTFPTKPNANPASVANFGYATDVVPSHVEWSPRVGFNYDLNGKGTAADSWRRRPLHGPAGVRVDFESVRQHRHRLHAHRRAAPTRHAEPIPFITDPLNQPTR